MGGYCERKAGQSNDDKKKSEGGGGWGIEVGVDFLIAQTNPPWNDVVWYRLGALGCVAIAPWDGTRFTIHSGYIDYKKKEDYSGADSGSAIKPLFGFEAYSGSEIPILLGLRQSLASWFYVVGEVGPVVYREFIIDQRRSYVGVGASAGAAIVLYRSLDFGIGYYYSDRKLPERLELGSPRLDGVFLIAGFNLWSRPVGKH
ncbi:MAG: hypothetical protein FWD57_02175 [Polyangiaceae bacterium]|nr:hypothetical protein [Polyangiaceae bacterium]